LLVTVGLGRGVERKLYTLIGGQRAGKFEDHWSIATGANVNLCRMCVTVPESTVTRWGAGRRGEAPLENFSPPLEKCVGSLKLLDIVQNIWAPLGKLFAPPGVASWLRAWCRTTFTIQADDDCSGGGLEKLMKRRGVDQSF